MCLTLISETRVINPCRYRGGWFARQDGRESEGCFHHVIVADDGHHRKTGKAPGSNQPVVG